MKNNTYVFIISRSVLLNMRNVSDRCCGANQNTHCMFSNFIWKSCSYAIRWKNIVQSGWPQITLWHIACWIPKPTDTHTHTHTHILTILIPFLLQRCLHERACLLRYTYIAKFVFNFVRVRGSCLKAEWARSTAQYSEAAEKIDRKILRLHPPTSIPIFISHISNPWYSGEYFCSICYYFIVLHIIVNLP